VNIRMNPFERLAIIAHIAYEGEYLQSPDEYDYWADLTDPEREYVRSVLAWRGLRAVHDGGTAIIVEMIDDAIQHTTIST